MFAIVELTEKTRERRGRKENELRYSATVLEDGITKLTERC
jgi:hypothetical protein